MPSSGEPKLYVKHSNTKKSTGRYWPHRHVISLRLGTDPVGRLHALLHEQAHARRGDGFHNQEWEAIAVELWRAAGLNARWVIEREEFYGQPLADWLNEQPADDSLLASAGLHE